MSTAADGLERFLKNIGRRADKPPRVATGGGAATLTVESGVTTSGPAAGFSDIDNDGLSSVSLTGVVVVILKREVYAGCRQFGIE